MSSVTLLASLPRRVGKRLAGMIPVIMSAVVIFAVFLLLLYNMAPFLPEQYQQLLQQLQSGDWASSRASVSQIFDGFGAAKPYVFLALQAVQVLIAPLPGQLVGMLGGYLFGFWHGLLLTIVGIGTGSFIAMAFGRFVGDRFVRRFIPKRVLSKFDYLIDQGGVWNFFMIFLLPALPDDAVCFIAGLTRLRLWKLLTVSIVGRLPVMIVFNLVGASVAGGMAITNEVLTAAIVGGVALWLFSDEVEAFFSRLSRGNVARSGESEQIAE